jgi:hypothetical protein
MNRIIKSIHRKRHRVSFKIICMKVILQCAFVSDDTQEQYSEYAVDGLTVK